MVHAEVLCLCSSCQCTQQYYSWPLYLLLRPGLAGSKCKRGDPGWVLRRSKMDGVANFLFLTIIHLGGFNNSNFGSRESANLFFLAAAMYISVVVPALSASWKPLPSAATHYAIA